MFYQEHVQYILELGALDWLPEDGNQSSRATQVDKVLDKSTIRWLWDDVQQQDVPVSSS